MALVHVSNKFSGKSKIYFKTVVMASHRREWGAYRKNCAVHNISVERKRRVHESKFISVNFGFIIIFHQHLGFHVCHSKRSSTAVVHSSRNASRASMSTRIKFKSAHILFFQWDCLTPLAAASFFYAMRWNMHDSIVHVKPYPWCDIKRTEK